MIAGLLAVVSLAVLAVRGLPSLPNPREAIPGVVAALGGWIWPFTGATAFFETSIPPLTLFFPGEFAILFVGVIAGQGEVPIVPVVLLVWTCSAAGDSVAFLLGRRFGRQFLLRFGAPLRLTEARLSRVDGWFDRYGSATIALGRLVPFVRPTAPFIAGSTSFPYRRFLAWSLLGTAVFSLVFCLLGYFFYRSYDDVVAAVGRGGFVLLAALVTAGLVAARIHRARRERTRVLP